MDSRIAARAMVMVVAVVLVALAVVLAGWGDAHQYPWDVEPRLVGWWRALCTHLR